jgi:UrcA family protein
MRKSAVNLLIACALALATHLVSAATPEEDTDAIRVQYATLDLSTPSGVEALRHRINIAAMRVCTAKYPGDPLTIYCIRTATERALAQVERRK